MTLPGHQPNDEVNRTAYLKKHLWQKRRNEIITYNDCLYRNIYDFKFIIPLDIDEVIIPVAKDTWAEMLDDYLREDRQALKRYASLAVRNAYFFKQYAKESVTTDNNLSENIEPDDKIPSHLYMLKHTVRSSNFSRPGHSVKSFVLTNVTKTTFNHYAMHPLFMKTSITKNLPLSVAQMNHYKDKCPRDMYTKCKNTFLKYKTSDYIIMKYKDQLIAKTEHVLKEMNFV
ncbi:UNVERIFIED_CONTAM: hypothetical protein GTU68_062827 [Idotea baltica]|nr:hypothetical protein [Idotea baltica]